MFINMAFVTDVREFQALLDACLSVRDWKTLTESRIERYHSVDHCDYMLRSVNHAVIERK